MSSLLPSMSGPSNAINDKLEKMFANFDRLAYGLSVGITIKDIEEDACARAYRCVSSRDAEASGTRRARYELYDSP